MGFQHSVPQPPRSSRFALLLLLASGVASATIQVFPTRIELSDEQRVANISVRHRGNQPGQYRIDAVFYRMNPDGTMQVVSDAKPEEHSLVQYLRFSPKQTTLPPNLEQVIRIIVAPPKVLAEGDYRAHLHFMPGSEAEADTGSSEVPQKKIRLALETRFALSIPVIYRHGAPKVTTKLADLKVVTNGDNQLAYQAELLSEGNAFAYGDLNAVFTPTGGAPVDLGAARGVASYLPKRAVGFPFVMPAGLTKLAAGKLRLEFREHRTDNEIKVLASTETDLP